MLGFGEARISVVLAGLSGEPVTVIDPAIESHYGTGDERWPGPHTLLYPHR